MSPLMIAVPSSGFHLADGCKLAGLAVCGGKLDFTLGCRGRLEVDANILLNIRTKQHGVNEHCPAVVPLNMEFSPDCGMLP